MPGYQTQGLTQRRVQRLAERSIARGAMASFPKGEQRDRHVAIVFLTTLPTRELLAVYRAAKTHLDRKPATFP